MREDAPFAAGLAARFALLVGAFLFVFVVLEIAVRAWLAFFASDDAFAQFASKEQRVARAELRGEGAFRYSPHPYVGWVPTPNHHRGNNHHNALGFRGEAFDYRKPTGEFRIVCLGGSTTYTSGVDHSIFAFPRILQDRLRDRGFSAVRVVNAGAEGYSTFESLVTLQFRVLELDPDLVIVYHGINDLFHRFVYPPSAFRADNSGALRRELPGMAPWWQRSSLLRLLAIRAGRLPNPNAIHSTFVKLPKTAHAFRLVDQLRSRTFPRGIFEHVSPEEMLAVNDTRHFEANLRMMSALARQRGVGILFATFALSTEKPDAGLTAPIFVKGIEQMNRAVARVGAEEGVPVYDFAAEFPSDPALFFDPVHVNFEGAAEKAQLFARYLAESPLLEGARLIARARGPPRAARLHLLCGSAAKPRSAGCVTRARRALPPAAPGRQGEPPALRTATEPVRFERLRSDHGWRTLASGFQSIDIPGAYLSAFDHDPVDGLAKAMSETLRES